MFFATGLLKLWSRIRYEGEHVQLHSNALVTLLSLITLSSLNENIQRTFYTAYSDNETRINFKNNSNHISKEKSVSIQKWLIKLYIIIVTSIHTNTHTDTRNTYAYTGTQYIYILISYYEQYFKLSSSALIPSFNPKIQSKYKQQTI